jgi:formate dehydrogenase subunit gamma
MSTSEPVEGREGGIVSRSTLRGAAALLVAFGLAASLAMAQSPAVSPKEADYARDQQKQQLAQPLNNQPVWKEVRSGAPQVTTVLGRETNVLIQPEGQTWRAVRVPIAAAGGWLLALVVLGLMGYYAWRGPIELHGRPTGRMIERFSTVKRMAHWSMAISFVVLAITGLVVTFGKAVLLPLIGYTLFSWLATLSKTLHNFIGPLFTVALAVFIVLFVRDNLPKAYDMQWLAKFGGMLDRTGKTHVPTGKFNAGEKALFWILVCFLSVVLVVTGLILDFPNFDQTRWTMQVANLLHLGAALLATAMAGFHIYLGTIGMRGAYEAMRYGYVDEAWAKEHHEYWYNDVASGKVPRGSEPSASVPLGQHKPA